MAGLVTGLAAVVALAMAAAQAATPPKAAKTPEETAQWYRANIQRGQDWRMSDYSGDGFVYLRKGAKRGKDGRAQGEVRVERVAPQSMSGFSWRSARLTADMDCKGTTLLNPGIGTPVDLSAPGAAARLRVRNPEHRITLTVFADQNLGGASKDFPLGAAALPGGPMGDALRTICDASLADPVDAPPVPDAIASAPDREGGRAWATAQGLDFKGWSQILYDPSGVILARRMSDTPAGLRFEVRQEWFEPSLHRTMNLLLQGMAGKTIDLSPNARAEPQPVWVRSAHDVWDYDCASGKEHLVTGDIYARHNLQTKVAAKPVELKGVTFQAPAVVRGLFRQACAAK